LRNKGTDLVELEVVQELVQLPVLLLLLELEVVLLKTVEGQLGLVIDVNLEWLQVSSQHLTMMENKRTDCMNFLQVVRISLERVAENIMTCLWWGVARKISWTSRRMSEGKNLSYG
jgi:hypothetical protein